ARRSSTSQVVPSSHIPCHFSVLLNKLFRFYQHGSIPTAQHSFVAATLTVCSARDVSELHL
ncbi:unnamed protein product, partial [Amoebophrya sp. A120]